MDSASIRKTFLEFFAERDHAVVPSSSLVPDDPTLLFTTAGMVQFKPYFEGSKKPPFPRRRATSVQKVLRAVDLEQVGKDARHLSFFEMLGNFSFGDYFKREAIAWAWEFVTASFGLSPDLLWATVHPKDEEAFRLWRSEVGLPDDRVLRVPTDFWDMGIAGPCGPCSHLYYDRGEIYGEAFISEGEFNEDRFFEIWNLVFIQSLMDDKGEVVGDLPSKNVDTGMGLERVATVLQKVPTVFDIDTLTAIRETAEQVIGKKYGEDPAIDVSLRVLTEHARGVTFAIADGVLPSNEERGYVLRRLIRRAVRYARLAGVDEPVLGSLTAKTIELFGGTYPELGRQRDLIQRIVEKEEDRFDETLRHALGNLEEEISAAKAKASKTLSGAVAFKLHDTYGFPLEMTQEISADEGLEVETEEFDALMQSQRERARSARQTYEGGAVVGGDTLQQILASSPRTEFVGHERLDSDAEIVALVAGGESRPAMTEGQSGELITNVTPFYPEGGGQVGDRGEIRSPSGVFRVEDTQWGVPGLIVHRGHVPSGELRTGQEAFASVDRDHREGVRQSHTATHMVHWALRSHLGEHAKQQGSKVEPGRLHFDFSHYERLAQEALAQLEEEVNRRVLYDDSVRAFETTYEFAMSIGAMALFGEKYGDFVRVVEIGDYSKELCGGTHVVHTGQVGVIKFTGESSVGAGLRRVEAFTGLAGLKYLNEQVERLQRIAGMLKVDPERVEERLQRLIDSGRELQTLLDRQRAVTEKEEVSTILSSGQVNEVGGAKMIPLRKDGIQVEDMRRLARAVRDEAGSAVVVIGSTRNGAANLVAAVSRDLIDRGVSARDLLAEGAALLGGKAGGGPDLATAGGPKGSEIDKAMAVVESSLRSVLEG